jgi:hypothetical protein
MNYINGITCYWKWVTSSKKKYMQSRQWELVFSFQTDGDGHPRISLPKEFKDWMGNEDFPTMGRAITTWDVANGVRLLDIAPPEEEEFLSVSFVEELSKLANWHRFLHGGHDLFLGTAREVEKYLFDGKE